MAIVQLVLLVPALFMLMTGCATSQHASAHHTSIETIGAKPDFYNLSAKLSKRFVGGNIKRIGFIDFVDLQGRTTELGRYLAEQLSVEMVNEEGVSVVDRANINNILAEHKLTMSGLVNPDNAKELGKFAGIDAIVTGTVTTMDSYIVLTIKAISTETAQIVAATKTTFKKTSDLEQLSSRLELSESQPKSASSGNVKQKMRAGPLIVTVDSVRLNKQGVVVFFTIDSQINSSLEVVKGLLIDSEGKEIKIERSQKTSLNARSKNQLMVVAEKKTDATANDLKPPFDLAIDFGLDTGTGDEQTHSVSFHGLKL
ncbi:MAG: FlgO family outer membrane protein [Endomicrobiales bacterium]|jgi:hypothetical protein